MPVFKTFVAFDTVIFENRSVFPGVCLTQLKNCAGST